MIYTLVIFPIGRASEWEWIAGTASPELSPSGAEPATHKWFSIKPTSAEEVQIQSTLTADDTKLSVDTETQSPQEVIEAATSLKPIGPEE